MFVVYCLMPTAYPPVPCGNPKSWPEVRWLVVHKLDRPAVRLNQCFIVHSSYFIVCSNLSLKVWRQEHDCRHNDNNYSSPPGAQAHGSELCGTVWLQATSYAVQHGVRRLLPVPSSDEQYSQTCASIMQSETLKNKVCCFMFVHIFVCEQLMNAVPLFVFVSFTFHYQSHLLVNSSWTFTNNSSSNLEPEIISFSTIWNV